MKRVLLLTIACFLLLSGACKGTGGESAPADGTTAPAETTRGEDPQNATEEETRAEDLPKGAVGNCDDLCVDSEAFCVLDDDGIFLGKDIYEAYRPASITKVLTALVTVECVSLDNEIVIPEAAVRDHLGVLSSGVRPSFRPGELVTVRDLLYAMLLPSTNAAGNILAFHVAGSIEAFTEMMNRKVKELGGKNSNFMNPHGMDEDGHYTCAYDMALVMRAAAQQPELKKIMGTQSYRIGPTEYCSTRWVNSSCGLTNGNYVIQGVYAAKPGKTALAGTSLVTAVERNGKHFYVCTLHSDEGLNMADTRNVIDYAYARYTGVKTTLWPIPHNLKILREDDNGVLLSYQIENRASNVRVVFWDLKKGTASAVYGNHCPDGKENTYLLKFPYKGSFALQVFAANDEGVENFTEEYVLYDGEIQEMGINVVNGKRYAINPLGFLYTTIAETPFGCYGMYTDGEICRGFVGDFFAGEDGRLVSGWVTYGGKKYYFQGDGRMARGRILIGGKLYEFNENGVLIE